MIPPPIDTPTPHQTPDDKTASAPPLELRPFLQDDYPWIAHLARPHRPTSISSSSPPTTLDPIYFASSSSPQQLDEDPALRLASEWISEIESCKHDRPHWPPNHKQPLPKFPSPTAVNVQFRAAARVRRNWQSHANIPPNF